MVVLQYVKFPQSLKTMRVESRNFEELCFLWVGKYVNVAYMSPC